MKTSTRESSHDSTRPDGHPAPGRYHVIVKAVDDSHAKYPKAMSFELEVLAGTVTGQEGRTMTAWHAKQSVSDSRLLRFFWAVGLIGDDVKPRDAEGKQLVVELVEFTRKDESGNERRDVRIDPSGGMWPLGHADGRDVPTAATAVTES